MEKICILKKTKSVWLAGIIFMAICIIICHSWKMASNDGFIKIMDNRVWKRHFKALTSESFFEISKWKIPFALLEYHLTGKKEVEKHIKLHNQYIGGKTIEEANKNARMLGYY